MITSKNQPWISVALDAMDIAFDNEHHYPNRSISTQLKNQAIGLLEKSINELGANEAWPFIKLAELIDDPEYKMSLYVRSMEYDKHIAIYEYVYEKICNDYPEIISKYKQYNGN